MIDWLWIMCRPEISHNQKHNSYFIQLGAIDVFVMCYYAVWRPNVSTIHVAVNLNVLHSPFIHVSLLSYCNSLNSVPFFTYWPITINDLATPLL